MAYELADVAADLAAIGAERREVGGEILHRYAGEYDCGRRLTEPRCLVVVWWDPEYAWVVSERRLDGVDVRIAHDFPTLEAAREYAWAHRGGE